MRKTALLLAATAGTLLSGCGNHQLVDAQRVAIADYKQQLPTPYRDGLVIESVHRHGNDLILVIRSPDITLAMAKAKPALLDALRTDEQQAMHELCSQTWWAPVQAAGGGVRRRFVDANGTMFFETTLEASGCPSP